MSGETENGRTHEPSLRELTAELDGLRELALAKLSGLREILDERDRLYKERDESRKTAVDAALQAAKEKTADAFLASEKAIVKAEDAQKEYNERSNEFRGTLEDQARTLLPRFEADSRFGAQDEKLEALRKEVQSLRESRSEGSSARLAVREVRTENAATSAQWVAVASAIVFGLGFVVSLVALIIYHR